VHLPAAVDPDEHDVLRVELEIEPGAAVGDDSRAVENLAARVRLALVVVEEDARASMTRSVPLMMKVPVSVISGISPK
jgi:hypothetical protein